MLDVHPPHESVHTWRDFSIHIATIVVGLLIAVGLEQTVEYVHHRHELAEVRESLRVEREQNRRNFAFNSAMFRLLGAQAQNDLLVLRYLQQHPGTPEEKLPGILRYTASHEPMVDAAWKTAQRTSVTEFMPRQEVTDNDILYRSFARIDDGANDIWAVSTKAGQFNLLDPDLSHLTPAQIADQIKFTQDYLTAIFRFGVYLENLNQVAPDFDKAPTRSELYTFRGIVRTPEDVQRIRPAQQQTDDRLKPFKAIADPAIGTAEKR